MHTQSRPTTPPPPLPPSYLADERWTQEHMSELVRDHPDEWIGVVQGQVIAHGSSSDDVRRAVARAHPEATPYACLIERHPRVYAG